MSWLIYALLSALFAGLVAILGKIGIEDVDSTLATGIRAATVALTAAMVEGPAAIGLLVSCQPDQRVVNGIVHLRRRKLYSPGGAHRQVTFDSRAWSSARNGLPRFAPAVAADFELSRFDGK